MILDLLDLLNYALHQGSRSFYDTNFISRQAE